MVAPELFPCFPPSSQCSRPVQVQVWFQNRRQRERTMRRAESEKRNGGADDSSIESLSSSTATEYPEAPESGWGDKELSAFLSTC